MQPIVVKRGKTVVVPVSMGFNVSDDGFTSPIHVDVDPESELISQWIVTFDTDGTDGELILTLDSTITTEIVQSSGYMDLNRVSGGTPLPVFDSPLLVHFED